MDWLQYILDQDTRLFLSLNSLHNDYWDTAMLLITRKETWIPFFLTIILCIIRDYRSKAVLILLFFALTILASDQISVLLKESVQRLRPVYNPEIEHMVHNVLRKGGKYGFVSSHAANSFSIFVFFTSIFRNRRFSLLLFLWAVIFSYSRIYSGVHYPLDILGGAILGALLGFVIYRILMFVENHFFFARPPKIYRTKLENRENNMILLVFVVLLSTMFIVISILHFYNYL